MEFLAIPGLFVYFLIGTVWSATVTRALHGDSGFLPLTLMLWPITLPVGLLIWVYCMLTDQDVSRIL